MKTRNNIRLVMFVVAVLALLAVLAGCKAGGTTAKPPANACSYNHAAYALKDGNKWECYQVRTVNGVNTLVRNKGLELKSKAKPTTIYTPPPLPKRK